jgi:predicted nucleic acid-binding protein
VEGREEEGVGRARGAPGGKAPARTLFCDTNVLVRLLTGDPPAQAERAAEALEAAAEGRFTLVVPDLVLAELAYVLTSAGVERERAAEHLARILDLPGVEVLDELVLRDTLDVWAGGRLDFADAYLAALARRVSDSGVLSFDRDLDRIPGVTRVDPSTSSR